VETFWHPAREAEEYKRATGKNFEEVQYILRLRGRGAFDVVIVPHKWGTRPTDLAITRTPDGALSLIRGASSTKLPE
jgi:hypothetical protein